MNTMVDVELKVTRGRPVKNTVHVPDDMCFLYRENQPRQNNYTVEGEEIVLQPVWRGEPSGRELWMAYGERSETLLWCYR